MYSDLRNTGWAPGILVQRPGQSVFATAVRSKTRVTQVRQSPHHSVDSARSAVGSFGVRTQIEIIAHAVLPQPTLDIPIHPPSTILLAVPIHFEYGRVRTRRNPIDPEPRFEGLALIRLADRQARADQSHEPPRVTR